MAATTVSRAIGQHLYGADPIDALTSVGATLLLAISALIATGAGIPGNTNSSADGASLQVALLKDVIRVKRVSDFHPTHFMAFAATEKMVRSRHVRVAL